MKIMKGNGQKRSHFWPTVVWFERKKKAKEKKHNLSLATPVKAGALRLKSKYDCRNLFSSPDLVWSSYTWR